LLRRKQLSGLFANGVFPGSWGLGFVRILFLVSVSGFHFSIPKFELDTSFWTEVLWSEGLMIINGGLFPLLVCFFLKQEIRYANGKGD
jgi:hypothetical protein